MNNVLLITVLVLLVVMIGSVLSFKYRKLKAAAVLDAHKDILKMDVSLH